MPTTVLAASALVFAAVAWNDLAHRSIPNLLSLAVLVLALLRLFLAPPPGDPWIALGGAAAVFAAALLCFARGWFGGGDVKLIAPTILLVGARDALAFLLVMALVGGVLAVLVMVHAALARRGRLATQPAGDGADDAAPATVPYGIAIAAAALIVLASQLHQG